MSVHNSALHTTGAVSFMDLFSTTTGIIGQKGRRGALMISMDIKHPDVYEFLKSKTDLSRITKANISCKVTNDFMEAVQNNEMWMLHFECIDNGELFEKEVHAVNLFELLCKLNWDYAEPGILFWDTVNNWHLMSEVEDYRFVTTNPCGELPLMDYGACLLGSINLSEFVVNPFTDKADFNMTDFIQCVHESVKALDEVVDENIPLHPLKGQRDYARDYRPIGLGVMGIADMLLKLNLQYGEDKAIDLCKQLAFLMINEAVFESAMLAKEKGSFPKCDKEAILKSEFLQCNIVPDIQKAVEEYGIRNAQLLAIAPTGSLSTMLGISGGIEPIYQTSYTRKIESLGDEDEFYTVFTPIVKEWLEVDKTRKEKDVITAMNVDPIDRVKTQSVWQQFVDNAISSTVNLPESATVDDVKNIYMTAWEYGLKGITIYRDKCKRSGVLGSFNVDKKETNDVCQECGGTIIKTNGCGVCQDCGYSPCSL